MLYYNNRYKKIYNILIRSLIKKGYRHKIEINVNDIFKNIKLINKNIKYNKIRPIDIIERLIYNLYIIYRLKTILIKKKHGKKKKFTTILFIKKLNKRYSAGINWLLKYGINTKKYFNNDQLFFEILKMSKNKGQTFKHYYKTIYRHPHFFRHHKPYRIRIMKNLKKKFIKENKNQDLIFLKFPKIINKKTNQKKVIKETLLTKDIRI